MLAAPADGDDANTIGENLVSPEEHEEIYCTCICLLAVQPTVV